jgi:hypothetical protein
MVFNLYEIVVFSFFLALIGLGIWGFRFVRGKKRGVRLTVRAISITLTAVSTLTAFSLSFATLQRQVLTSVSAPIYSPDHKHALRIEDFGDRTGSNTHVYLYSHFGFNVNAVFSGSWKSVRPEDISWINDSEISITYRDSKLPYSCASAQHVKVYMRRAVVSSSTSN